MRKVIRVDDHVIATTAEVRGMKVAVDRLEAVADAVAGDEDRQPGRVLSDSGESHASVGRTAIRRPAATAGGFNLLTEP